MSTVDIRNDDETSATNRGEVACLEADHSSVSVERILQQFYVKKNSNENLLRSRHQSFSTAKNDDNSNDDCGDGYQQLERSLLSLLQADSSLAFRKYRLQQRQNEKDDHPPNEEGFLLFHHLCVTVSSSYSCPVGLLQKVFESYPDAVVNDPAIMHHLLMRPCPNGYLEGAFLDLVGMVGEQWPQVYQELEQRKQQHQRLSATVSCGWNRLVDSDRMGPDVDGSPSEGEPSLFELYPHLIQHMTSMAVNVDGLDQEEEQGEEGNTGLPIRSSENKFVRSRRIQQIMQQLVKSKRIVSLSLLQVSYKWGSDLQVRFPRRRGSECTAVDTIAMNDCERHHHHGNDEGEELSVSYSCLDDIVDILQPFFCKHNQSNRGGDQLHVAKLRVGLYSTDRNTLDSMVMRMARLLVGFHVSEFILFCPPGLRLALLPTTPCRAVNELFGVVAKHPTVQRLSLQCIDIHVEEDGMDLGNLARLDNLERLVLLRMNLGDSMVPPLARLVQQSDKLQHLDVRGNRIVDAELLVMAVGRSRSLRVFGCDFDRTDLLENLAQCMETSNTTMVRVLTEIVQVRHRKPRRRGRRHLGGANVGDEVHTRSTDPLYDAQLRDRIKFLCALNRMGRGRLRETTLTKAELVVDILGSDDFHRFRNSEKLEPLLTTSLLYGLLRENPVVWCT